MEGKCLEIKANQINEEDVNFTVSNSVMPPEDLIDLTSIAVAGVFAKILSSRKIDKEQLARLSKEMMSVLSEKVLSHVEEMFDLGTSDLDNKVYINCDIVQ